MMRFACSSCSFEVSVPEERAHLAVSCPRCGTAVVAPVPASSIQTKPSASAQSPLLATNPSDDVLLQAPSYRLYSTRQIAVAAFLGGPLGGFLLVAINYARLRRAAAAWGMVAVGILATAALVFFPDRFLPERAGWLVVGLPGLVATVAVAHMLQGAAFQQHIQRGGRPASPWGVAGVGLASLVLIVGAVVGVELLTPDEPRVTFPSGEEIIYAEGASEADAQKLATVLQAEKVFDGKSSKTVRLSRPKGGVVIGIVYGKNAWKDPEVVSYYEGLRARLIEQEFLGPSITIELCDDELKARKRIP
jgi:DNA-directed RNA polymerase subunit RPC12/RpoP